MKKDFFTFPVARKMWQIVDNISPIGVPITNLTEKHFERLVAFLPNLLTIEDMVKFCYGWVEFEVVYEWEDFIKDGHVDVDKLKNIELGGYNGISLVRHWLENIDVTRYWFDEKENVNHMIESVISNKIIWKGELKETDIKEIEHLISVVEEYHNIIEI